MMEGVEGPHAPSDTEPPQKSLRTDRPKAAKSAPEQPPPSLDLGAKSDPDAQACGQPPPAFATAVRRIDEASGAPLNVKKEMQSREHMLATKRARGRFYRGLEAPSLRTARSEDKCSPQLAMRMKSSSQSLGHWFQVYQECGATFSDLEMVVKNIDAQSTATHKKKVAHSGTHAHPIHLAVGC